MRNILLGTLGGLAMGVLGSFAYNNYFGEGPKLAQAETELTNAHNSLAQNTQSTQQFKSEADAMSA